MAAYLRRPSLPAEPVQELGVVPANVVEHLVQRGVASIRRQPCLDGQDGDLVHRTMFPGRLLA